MKKVVLLVVVVFSLITMVSCNLEFIEEFLFGGFGGTYTFDSKALTLTNTKGETVSAPFIAEQKGSDSYSVLKEGTKGSPLEYSDSSSKDLLIVTDGEDVTINAQNSTAKHFGSAGKVDIQAIKSNSYHENGKVELIKVAQGRVVIENSTADNSVNVANIFVVSTKAIIAVHDYNAIPVITVSGTITKDKTEGSEVFTVQKLKQDTQVVEVTAVGTVTSEKKVTFAGTVMAKELSTPIEPITEETLEVSADGTIMTLSAFRDSVNAGNSYQTVKLLSDIDLNGEAWTPIGTSSNPFSGVFDGNNYTINNLSISEGGFIGLFGYVKNGTIKNVKLVKATVSGTERVGGLIGRIVGDATVDNCSIDSTSIISGTSSNTGGLIAEINCNDIVTVNNCVNYATVINTSSSASRAAGICCQVTGTGVSYPTSSGTFTFNNCYNYGEIQTQDGYPGGIISAKQNSNNTTIFDNCVNHVSLDSFVGICKSDLVPFLCGDSCTITVKNYSGDLTKAFGKHRTTSTEFTRLIINNNEYASRLTQDISIADILENPIQISVDLFDRVRGLADTIEKNDSMHRTTMLLGATSNSTNFSLFRVGMTYKDTYGGFIPTDPAGDYSYNHWLELYNESGNTTYTKDDFNVNWENNKLYKIN